MANALLVVRSPHDSGLPKDVTINTFSINTAAEPIEDVELELSELIEDFYKQANTNHPIDWYLSNVLTSAFQIVAYDRADPEPRVPIWTHNSTRSASWPGSSTPYPSEVAVTLSFQAAAVSGVPQASRRGRIFLGPLNPGAAAFTSGVARPAQIFIDDLCVAAARLRADAITAGFRWQVWSPKLGSGADVASGWVDNALDTQRRRGEAATTRTIFT